VAQCQNASPQSDGKAADAERQPRKHRGRIAVAVMVDRDHGRLQRALCEVPNDSAGETDPASATPDDQSC